MKKNAVSDKGPSSRKKNDLFQKRQLQIVKKAAKLFMKKGYAQTSMREISKATGIDISNLYYFIKSKEDILFRVFEMVHQREIELFEQQASMNIDNPLEQLRTVINEMLTLGWDYREEILLLYRESKALPKSLLKIILGRESHVVGQIEDILKKGLDRKVFHLEDPSFTANMIIYELSLFPLRNWNLKKYPKEELLNLVENHIMKAVMI
jgi:AcrR family transcriptional regulator